MNNKDESAFPVKVDTFNGSAGFTSNGLTKREYFAALAMQGQISYSYNDYNSAQELAEESVRLADALLLALDESQ